MSTLNVREITPTLPHDDYAERVFLGSIIIDETVLEAARVICTPTDLYRTQNAIVYGAVLALADRGSAIDLVTLRSALDASGELEAAGVVGYLAGLTDGIPRAGNVSHYGTIVADCARARRLARKALDAYQAAIAGDAPEALRIFGEEDDLGPCTVEPELLADILADESLNQARPVVNGLLELAELSMLVGDGGMGKSRIALSLANAVQAGVPWLGRETVAGPVLVVSLEDSRRRLQERARAIGVRSLEATVSMSSMPTRSLDPFACPRMVASSSV